MALPEGVRRSYSGGAIPTTLAANISDSATTLQVLDGSTFPVAASGKYAAVLIDEGLDNEELVWYSDRSGQTFNNLLRGGDGTEAFAHTIGATIKHVPTALDFDEANKHYATTDPNFIPHVQLVSKTVAQEITADHELSGNILHSGATVFEGAVTATGSFHVDAMSVDEIDDPVTFNDKITYADTPIVPKTVTPTSVASIGTSRAAMAADAQIAIDPKAWLRAEVPAGTIRIWAGSNLPGGLHAGEWAWCDGGDDSASLHPEYATNVGTTYGGTAAAPKRPNLNGRVPVGADGGHAMGTYGGSTTHVITIGEMPSHAHNVNENQHFHNPPNGFDYVISSPVGEQHWITGLAQAAGGPGNTQVTFTRNVFAATGITLQSTGGNQAFNIEQPWTAVKYKIKVH